MEVQLCFQQEFSEAARLDLEAQTAATVEAVTAVCGPLPGQRVNIIVATAPFVHQLNNDYRGKDSVTDVLTFPLGAEEAVTGEIYICWPRVVTQAETYGHSRQREFCFLLTHGILHLLGHQHGAEPNPEMRALEEAILSRLDLGRV